MMNNNKDKMHPEDIRNLIIFIVLSGVVWFVYETFILKPQSEALKNAKVAREVLIEKNPEYTKDVEFIARDALINMAERVPFKNDDIHGSINLRGGRIDDLSLGQYYETLEKKKNVVLLIPNRAENARYIDYGWVSSDKTLSLPDAETLWSIEGNAALSPDFPVKLVWDNGQGFKFERTIAMDKEYVFKISQRVFNNSEREVTLYPFALVSQVGVPKGLIETWAFHEGPVGFIDRQLIEKTYSGMKSEGMDDIEAQRGWIGFSDKYWLTALIPTQDSVTKYRFKHTPDPVKTVRDRYQIDFTGDAVTVPPNTQREYSYNLFAGAKKVFVLKEYSKTLGIDSLDLAVDFGWFWFLTYPFYVMLHYLGLIFGNMGVAIILMTLIVRGSVFPLTKISYRSFAKMKVISPRLGELRKQYGDDKEKLQAEIVQLYQKEGVNPMSGCLPILVQIPIFFAFYKTIFVTIEIRHAPFFGWIQDLSAKDPTSVFNLFGLLPYDVPSFLVIGVWPCLMLIATLMQKQLNPPPQDKIQKDMMTFFPFFITFIMASFASGLVIYWTVSAFMGVFQQAWIMRSMGVPIYIFNKDHYKEELEKQVDEGPSVHPLIEMTEDETEKALFGGDDQPKNIKPPKPKKKKKKS